MLLLQVEQHSLLLLLLVADPLLVVVVLLIFEQHVDVDMIILQKFGVFENGLEPNSNKSCRAWKGRFRGKFVEKFA